MIHILADRRDQVTTELVARAFERCFTRGQVRVIETAAAVPPRNAVLVALAPVDAIASEVLQILGSGGKVILLGALGPRIAEIAGVELIEADAGLARDAGCDPAPTYGLSESRACLRYHQEGLGSLSPLRERRFCRFDFANEWNNLGYGRIGIGSDRWAIDQLARKFEQSIADLTLDGCPSPGAAVTLCDRPAGAVLWFSRPVGPIDGPDWAIIETFISAHRGGELACRPYLRDIPHGCGAAVTMRLDCDEDIASARPLLELYRARGKPLSLAIKADQPERPAHLALINDLRASGGSILSHSASHAPNWGGSAEAAEAEARRSKKLLENYIEGVEIRYAVSPFHQNPNYVPAALARAGYGGFVGGIIANDPEYLMARAGVPPFSPDEIISHTQSCMLHGDCLLDTGDRLRIYKAAFALARDGGQFFGYLDHPFSERYAYGWVSETDRVAAHAEFLDYMEANSGSGPLLFVNEETCLNFIKRKASARIHYDGLNGTCSVTHDHAAGLPISVSFHGRSAAVHHG